MPIEVFVGATEAETLAITVLEHSIRQHAGRPVRVSSLARADVEIPQPRRPGNRPRTLFSLQRFLIPALMHYRGRAIYLDSDMVVYRDISELWTLDFQGAQVLSVRPSAQSGRQAQFSVMLLDCGALDWEIARIIRDMDAGAFTYEALMVRMVVADRWRADIDPVWNSLESYDEGTTALLHYTDVASQPWLSCRNPLNHLWTRVLFDAIERGAVSLDLVRQEVARGHVRPSLLPQVQRGIEDARQLPDDVQALDRRFRRTTWRSRIAALRAHPIQYTKSALASLSGRASARP